MHEIKHQYLARLEKEIKSLHWPTQQYAIWGSGVLAIRGLRKAQDIDIVVKEPLWHSLANIYPPLNGKYGGFYLQIGTMEIWNNMMNMPNLTVEEVIDAAEMVEGYPFMSLDHTIQWKQFLRRPKDLSDLALIHQMLEKS